MIRATLPPATPRPRRRLVETRLESPLDRAVVKAGVRIPISAEDRGESRSEYRGQCGECATPVVSEFSGRAPLVWRLPCPACSAPMAITKGGL